MEPTPFEMFWLIFYKYIRNMSKLCGYDIYDPEYQGINWKTRLFYFFMVLSMVSMVYTMISYQIGENLIAASLFVMPVQGVLKFSTYFSYIEENRANLRNVHDIYLVTADPKKSSYPIMLRWSKLFFSIVRFFYMVIFLTLVTILLYPVYLYVMSGNREPMIPVYVPGIDESTISGYVILTMIHFVWACQGAIGVGFADF